MAAPKNIFQAYVSVTKIKTTPATIKKEIKVLGL